MKVDSEGLGSVHGRWGHPHHLVIAGGLPDVRHIREAHRWSVVKRLLDVSCGTLLLIAVLPVVLVIALMVKATSRGPVFFLHDRLGRDGTQFRMIKLRTMRHGTHQEVIDDEGQHAYYASNDFKSHPDDPRITPVGRVVRKTSLDELPQLINVLRGEMSLVGIRPMEAAQVATREPYDQAVYRLMAPGMTGLWQVEGRSSLHPEKRRELDKRYVETWSVWNDIKILIRTPFAVLRIHQSH